MDGETERQRDRETERQRDRETERQNDGLINRRINRSRTNVSNQRMDQLSASKNVSRCESRGSSRGVRGTRSGKKANADGPTVRTKD